MPVEHHYLVTETIPEIAAMDHELPVITEAEAGYYSRQEGQGLLLGAYENVCHHWSVDGTPLDFDHELLPDDLERMELNFLRAVDSMPPLGEAGIKRIINGPMIFSPDLGSAARPLPGPEELHLRLRRDDRLQSGRRHRPGDRPLDHRRRAEPRHLSRGM